MKIKVKELSKKCTNFELELMRAIKAEDFDGFEGLKNAMTDAAAALNWVSFQIRKMSA